VPGTAEAELSGLAFGGSWRPSPTRRQPFACRWVPVPDDFGRSKQRAAAFAAAWQHWAGPSELLFTQRSAVGHQAAALAGAQATDYHTSTRRIWV